MMSAASAGLWPLDRARDVDTNAGGWPTADARMAGDGDAVVVETAGHTRHGLLERVQLVEHRACLPPESDKTRAPRCPGEGVSGGLVNRDGEVCRQAPVGGSPGSSAAADSSPAQRR